MKLSDRDMAILGAAELDASASVADLAKRSGYRPTQVRYVLNRLEREGIISRTVFADMYRLGFCDYVLCFSIRTASGSAKARALHAFLLESPYVTWVGELSGPYQYGVAIFAHDVHEFVAFLDVLAKQFGDILFQKSVRITRTFTRFNRKYLAPHLPVRSLSFGFHPEQQVIDEIDNRLLMALSQPDQVSIRQTTLRLGIPLSTGHQRIRRLEQRGIIAGHLYSVDAPRFGYTLFNVNVYTKGLRETLRTQLFNWAKEHPHIIHFIECVGEWDFELGVEVSGPEHTTTIVQELFEKFGDDLIKIEVVPILRNLKYVFYRPIIEIQKAPAAVE